MHPVICTIGPFTIYSYGLMLVIGFAVGAYLSALEARKEHINPDIIFNLAFLSFVAGVIGARIFYCIENAQYYLRYPQEILMLQRGGLAWFGGLIAGAIAGVMYLKKKKQPVLKVLDVLMPFLALAQAFGRIGCLLNGCCYGKASSFGLYFPSHGAFLIPTQAYSSLALLAIYAVLRFMQNRPHKEGEIFFFYLLLYSVKRFSIEFWRADNPVIFRGLTLFQLLSVIIFFLSLYKLIRLKMRNY